MIKNKDRKFLAVDMESAGVTKSTEDFETEALIVRVISDAADETKEALDKLGDDKKGKLRNWALSNGVTFLSNFLPQYYFFPI